MTFSGRFGDGARPPIVGRAEQCGRLRTTLDEVVVDGSRLVLVGGDAGSGKTTVVEAFAAELSGSLADRHAQVVHGQCVPLGGEGLPYAPIVGVLRELVGRHGAEQVLEWAGTGRRGLGSLLPDLVEPPEQTESLRLQLFEAVTTVWEQASATGPLVVVVEDIHWADESTRHLLRFLTRALADASVMVIATYRTDELTRRHPLRPFLAEVARFPSTVRIEVPSLDRAEVAELLAGLLGHEPSRAVVDLVHRRSEGVPYFVEELASSAAQGCVDMPDTLRDALNVRVQTLSDSAQDTLGIAAVGGSRISHALLEAVATATPTELEADLREAVDAAVLRVDDTGYAFRHALLREVVHEDLLPGQHARLHARFAEALEAQPTLIEADLLALETAYHWSAAHNAPKAFAWSIKAATTGRPAHHEALKMYERALELWDRVEDPEAVAGTRASVLERAALAANDAGETDRALTLIEASLQEPDADESADVRINRLIFKGRMLSVLLKPGAVEALSDAVDAIPADGSALVRARALDQLATVLMVSGHRKEAVDWARKAIDAAVAAGSAALESSARNTFGESLIGLGEEEEGMPELVRAGDLSVGSTRVQLRFYVNYSDALHSTGRHREAVDQALAGIEVARSIGLERSLGAMLGGNAAEPLFALGEWDRAQKMVERALELDPPAHHFVHLRLLQAWLALWQGDLERADLILAQWRRMLVDHPAAPQYAAFVTRTDSELALATGDVDRAWTNGAAFLEQISVHHAADVYPVLAATAAAASSLDRTDPAGRVEAVRAALAQAKPINVRAAWLPLIEAELNDTADGWRTGLAGLVAAHSPAHLPAYAGLRLGQHLVALRERTEAREVLAVAAGRAEAVGVGLLTVRIAALAQRAGFAVAPANPGGNPLAGLTPRELEVLELVTQGRSNGEIGATLFISTKTASVHVSNILAKLGVGSRGEAAALAHREGLVPAL